MESVIFGGGGKRGKGKRRQNERRKDKVTFCEGEVNVVEFVI